MFFCGLNTSGGESACELTPTKVDQLNYVEIENAYFDDLYISNNPSVQYDMTLPEDWDWNTFLYAKFNGTTYGYSGKRMFSCLAQA